MLKATEDIVVAGQASTVREAIEEAQRTRPDVVVMDIRLADGSEIVTRRVGGPSLSVYVGSGSERYGSCTARLRPARLAGGSLPILQTSYADAAQLRIDECRTRLLFFDCKLMSIEPT